MLSIIGQLQCRIQLLLPVPVELLKAVLVLAHTLQILGLLLKSGALRLLPEVLFLHGLLHGLQ